MRNKFAVYFGVMLMVVGSASACLGQCSVRTEFISLPSAQPVLEGFRDALPPDLKAAGPLDAAKWSAWVQHQDREVRNRLIRGEEDTLVNLLRFGVTFTTEYRIDDECPGVAAWSKVDVTEVAHSSGGRCCPRLFMLVSPHGEVTSDGNIATGTSMEAA